MLRGLKKALSKGRSADVEVFEGEPAQLDAFNSVSVRAKPAASTNNILLKTEGLQSNSLAGFHCAQSVGGQNAWDSIETLTPPGRRSVSATFVPPSVPTPSPNNLLTTAVSSGARQAPASAMAWGPTVSAKTPQGKDASRPLAGKDVPKHQSRLSGLFRSGSKNARSSTSDEATAVEPAMQFLGASGAQHQDSSCVAVYGNPRSTPSTEGAPKGNILNDECSLSTGRVLRTGSLMATPMTMEARRGPPLIR